MDADSDAATGEVSRGVSAGAPPGFGPGRLFTPKPTAATESSPVAAGTLEPWAGLSVAAGTLAAAGNVAGLLWPERLYGMETTALVDQAIAQDLVGLVVVAPALVVLAVLARRGSVTAHLLWLGALAFTVYNYVIYTFAVHFGPLFLLWVAVLGLSLYALIGGMLALDQGSVDRRFAPWPHRVTGWSLVVVAVAFSVLWLQEVLPAMVFGDTPQSVTTLALPTNPVHVLDLAFFLPAVFLAGWLVLHRRPLGLTLAPGVLTFLTLTGLPIVLTPGVAEARGQEVGWSAFGPVGALTVLTVVVLLRLLRG
jgi:hypothetical protein